MKSIEELCNEEISALQDVEIYEESFNNRTDAFFQSCLKKELQDNRYLPNVYEPVPWNFSERSIAENMSKIYCSYKSSKGEDLFKDVPYRGYFKNEAAYPGLKHLLHFSADLIKRIDLQLESPPWYVEIGEVIPYLLDKTYIINFDSLKDPVPFNLQKTLDRKNYNHSSYNFKPIHISVHNFSNFNDELVKVNNLKGLLILKRSGSLKTNIVMGGIALLWNAAIYKSLKYIDFDKINLVSPIMLFWITLRFFLIELKNIDSKFRHVNQDLIIKFIKKIYTAVHYDLPERRFYETGIDTNIQFTQTITHISKTFVVGERKINKQTYINKTIRMMLDLWDEDPFHYDKNLHGILGLRASFVANTHVYNTYISKSPALLLSCARKCGTNKFISMSNYVFSLADEKIIAQEIVRADNEINHPKEAFDWLPEKIRLNKKFWLNNFQKYLFNKPKSLKCFSSTPILIYKCIHPNLQKDIDFYGPALKSKPGLIGQISPEDIKSMDFTSFNEKTKNKLHEVFSNTFFYKNLSLLEKAYYSRRILS